MHAPRQIPWGLLDAIQSGSPPVLRLGAARKTGLLREKLALTQEKRRNFEHSLPAPVYIIG
jgi:hypothetical protein